MKVLMVSGAAALMLAASTVQAQEMRSAADWCRETGEWRDSGGRACDVREYTVASNAVDVNAGKNGGVRVIGGSRTDTLVRARVVSTGETQADADALVKQVQVSTDGGKVTATGPERTGDRRGWHVSFEVWVPNRADVSARTSNGGISISDVAGKVGFEAVNGGVMLKRVSGDVRGKTVNGGVNVELAGDHWDGAGLDARTTNGGVSITVPDGYSCQLAVATVNGGVRSDFPLTMQGRLDKNIDVTLGAGGAPVRVATTNGGVHLKR
jgi:hypothetical protein